MVVITINSKAGKYCVDGYKNYNLFAAQKGSSYILGSSSFMDSDIVYHQTVFIFGCSYCEIIICLEGCSHVTCFTIRVIDKCDFLRSGSFIHLLVSALLAHGLIYGSHHLLLSKTRKLSTVRCTVVLPWNVDTLGIRF